MNKTTTIESYDIPEQPQDCIESKIDKILDILTAPSTLDTKWERLANIKHEIRQVYRDQLITGQEMHQLLTGFEHVKCD